MAKAKSKSKGKSRGKTRAASSAASRRQAPQDAIALLKADHRQVEEWFEQFEKARQDERKVTLASNICLALKVHTMIEEEIVYPAFLEATDETSIHHEAEIEHDGAKKLIEQIEASGPDDDYYDAKVKVLSEMIKHHVREEEKSDGMFAKARQSSLDLKALGEQLAMRKTELMGEAESGGMLSERAARGNGARNQVNA